MLYVGQYQDIAIGYSIIPSKESMEIIKDYHMYEDSAGGAYSVIREEGEDKIFMYLRPFIKNKNEDISKANYWFYIDCKLDEEKGITEDIFYLPDTNPTRPYCELDTCIYTWES